MDRGKQTKIGDFFISTQQNQNLEDKGHDDNRVEALPQEATEAPREQAPLAAAREKWTVVA